MKDKPEILISQEEINEKIRISAERLSDELRDQPILFVSILTGAFIFTADYMRQMSTHCEIAFMSASSYGDSDTSSGVVKVELDIKKDISAYNVVILEDIIDTGNTIAKVTELLRARHPISLRVIALLDKPSRRINGFKADEVLFEIEDKFVVGYGLDHAGKYRELPYVGVCST